MNQNQAPRHRRSLLAGITVVIALSAAGCGAAGNSNANNEAPAQGDKVTMRLIAYKPATITIKAGATITWVQMDAGAHTVTSGTVKQGGAFVTEMPDGKFNSGEIATGKTFEFTFDEAGVYPYFCQIHPATMRGEVRVQ